MCCVVRICVAALLCVLAAGVREAPAQSDNGGCVVDGLAVRTSSATATVDDPQPDGQGGYLTEPGALTKSINLAIDALGQTGGTKTNGFYVRLSNMITGAGWLSGGPGYRHYLMDQRAIADVSGAVSWHFYKMLQGRFEFTDLANSRLSVGAQTMWEDNTQVYYYGTGPHSSEDAQSQYRVQDTDLVGYAAYQAADWLTVRGSVGWLLPPIVTEPGGPFQPGVPNTLLAFPNVPGVNLSRQPNFLHSQGSVTADNRDYPGHPTTGGLYRAAITAYWDRTNETFSFNEYEAEGLQMIPLTENRRWVIGLHGWTVMTGVPPGHRIPFYLQPSLGGNNTLRGFKDFRFHDNNLAEINVESRWALYTHVDAAVFFDAGNVAGRAADLDLAKTCWGAGLRVHTKQTAIGRLDVARSAQDGWQVFLRTSDPLRLSRLSRHIAVVPFAP